MITAVRKNFILIGVTVSAALLSADSNRLIDESSPYLRQHAHNPVDWYPWGEEAFAKAHAENKPIFLSIGYSTCHWCHVMAKESFSDDATAAILNRHFVSIKVDREERPDLDQIYMTFVQAATGNGGWPLNVWLTPDRKPFYGGVYFPPEDRGRTPGFKSVLNHLVSLWNKDNDQVYAQSDKILSALARDIQPVNSASDSPWSGFRRAGMQHLDKSFDDHFGGFGSSQKFPNGPTLEFLVNLTATHHDPNSRDRAAEMLIKTLQSISTQGLYDHVGGGFHRYTVDKEWRVPHFEKMLYDQAQITHALISAWQLTETEEFRSTALATLAYVQSNLTHPDGGFFSAEDAVSFPTNEADQKIEGGFYTWTDSQISDVLPASHLQLFQTAFGVREQGNIAAAHDPHGNLKGKNVLHRNRTNAQLAKEFHLTADTVDLRLSESLSLLKNNRKARPRPHLDDKIVAAWNGLMISAFARAGQIFNDPDYTQVATRSAKFIRERLYDETTGNLARSYHGGKRTARGFAEDYAYLIQGLIDLYESDFDTSWLEWALTLQSKQNELFEDSANGGFFASDPRDPSIVLRMKKEHDDVEPAATSVSVRNLSRLAALFHDESLLDAAKKSANSLTSVIERSPVALPQLLASAYWLTGDAQQALVHTASNSSSQETLIAEIRSRYHPRRLVVRIDETSRAFFQERVPFITGLPDKLPGSATVYICENFVCQMPTSVHEELVEILDHASSLNTE